MIGRYEANGVTVDAFRWDGVSDEVAVEFVAADGFCPADAPERVIVSRGQSLLVQTIDGEVRVSDGDWLLRNEDGVYSTMPSGVFAATFTRVKDEAV